jgi:phosphatidylserine decarboxylase
MMTTAPTWTEGAERIHIVGLPINAMLDWPMGTPSGFAFFLDPDVNAMLKKVLNVWGEFLVSPESKYVLNKENGWFGPQGHKDLTITANLGEAKYKFEEMFVCDPSEEYHGFNSWDEFFTRVFREGIRPVASPEDDATIANSCESLTYRLSHDVKARDRFWVKGQFYSVYDMLAHHKLAEEFVGGTVYQAFLSALSYHRWHAPVSGKIVKAFVEDGTYFSEPLFEGIGDPEVQEIDIHGQSAAQGYITAVATRAIIFIQADNPKIGLMVGVYVGMAEVSTCDITVHEGQHVKKGEQLGMFHFGGSTHCLLFRKGVQVEGFPVAEGREWNVPVRSKLAIVR